MEKFPKYDLGTLAGFLLKSQSKQEQSVREQGLN